MAQIAAGQKMPDFVYDTPFQSDNRLSETVKRVEGKTALVFLRYYGCRLCQMDLMDFSDGYAKIAATGGQLLVALQSDPAGLSEQFRRDGTPFDVICDPGQKLYRMLDIRPAAAKEFLKDETSVAKFERMLSKNIVHGPVEGDDLQLPAAFVVDRGLNVSYAHYGRVITDVPTVDELAKLL